MAGHMQLTARFNEEQQHVVFQINEGAKAWAHVTLELPEFIPFLEGLAVLRQQFSEQVPSDLDPGTRAKAIFAPTVMVVTGEAPFPEGTKVLMMRHPGYGWIGYAIPRDHALELAQVLSEV